MQELYKRFIPKITYRLVTIIPKWLIDRAYHMNWMDWMRSKCSVANWRISFWTFWDPRPRVLRGEF